MSNNDGFYTARFKPAVDLHFLPKEHCSVNVDQIKTIGRNLSEQVRLELTTENGIIPAVYTVGKVHQEEWDRVYVGSKIVDFVKCLHDNTDPCMGRVKAKVTVEGLDEEQAKLQGEFIEQLRDNGQNQRLVVIAPHGGEIENKTDNQAEIVRSEISPDDVSDDVSLWICKGFDKEDKSANERWHITATQINEKSFPMLNTIYYRKFKYAIAFHGWLRDNICVGGSKDNKTVDKLKVEIKDAIWKALRELNSDIQVNVSGCPECPGEFNGDNPDNIVNRLAINGIQIEQCKEVRKNYYRPIAEAVAKAIRPWMSM